MLFPIRIACDLAVDNLPRMRFGQQAALNPQLTLCGYK